MSDDNAIEEKDFNFCEIKRRLFEAAVELYTLNINEIVTREDIADKANVDKSDVYDHFASDQEVLTTIYGYFKHYLVDDRRPISELDPVLENGSLMDIIHLVGYSFKESHEELMISCYTVILGRSFTDDAARQIIKFMFTSSVEHVENIFKRAIEIGRLAPFDTRLMGEFCYMNRFFLFFCFLNDRTSIADYVRTEEGLYKYAITNLIDLHDNEI